MSSPSTASSARAKAASDPAWLHLDNQLCFALYSSSLAMTRLYKPLLDPLGLTYPQYLTLLALWENDGAGVGELGERLFLDSGTLTPLLKRMEGAGLVRRERARDDERRVLVHLTSAGRALRVRARAVPREIAGATGCNAEDLRTLTRHLQLLRAQVHGSAALAHS
jgi:DNA-binding MarR family transcriptional regulator